jgi:hypothetical protein
MAKAAQNNDQALNAFIGAKASIDQMLGELQAMSNDHFNTHPDEINWADVGPASTSCGSWPSKNLTGVSLPVNADIPADIQVHFVDEFDAHASPTGARGIGELGATGVAAAVANAVYDAVRSRIRDLPITLARLLSA